MSNDVTSVSHWRSSSLRA